MTSVRNFVESYFHHFNARELRRCAAAYEAHVAAGGRMFVSIAGAMSSARFGAIFARAIRAGLVHGISCTGANLEEDAYRLLSGGRYELLPDWRTLTPGEEAELHARRVNRVTDMAIPEEVMTLLDEHLYERWLAACESARSARPGEMLLDVLRDPEIQGRFERPEESWLLAADEMAVPIWTPGWEDSTSGNAFSAAVMRGEIPHHRCIKSGTEQMTDLARWYLENCEAEPGIGFFQIGGGIAGDFAICVVPLLRRDLGLDDTPTWGYFAQITDAEVSYGGYSGATDSEKISWGKLAADTPRFTIKSDATIVAPLIFAWLLGD